MKRNNKVGYWSLKNSLVVVEDVYKVERGSGGGWKEEERKRMRGGGGS